MDEIKIYEDKIPKQRITETNLNRIVNTHMKKGMIIISAVRVERTQEENKIKTEELKTEIKKAGYSFIPVMGGYISTDQITGEKKEDVETSFIVPTSGDNKELFDLGKSLCKEFNQETFLYSDGTKPPAYFTSDGTLDFSFSGGIKYNDLMQQYFTQISKYSEPKNGSKYGKSDKRFTFESVYYINVNSATLNENVIRLLRGEHSIFERKI